MLNKKLPQGYRTEYGQIVPGTGYGDEIYGTILYHWETRTVGRLWWKRSVTGWHRVGGYRHEAEAISWARDTERARKNSLPDIHVRAGMDRPTT